ncbi:hypothetical protein G4B88_025665 [Cannabis sativa]|uniref:Uncharacterized protein n=1 Tax=Cannabis sativa TaxID=3483 RepID=A0A7J6F4D6_CANSA|nr:hypothetical protein G4B88_025665 [Cannabis sativa]
MYVYVQKELLDPAVKGTLNILRSCVKLGCVKRVVLTSSMAAVMYNGKSLSNPNVVLDETWFSDPLYCEELKVSQTFPNRVYSYVDVRDVALAHLQAFEVASANGRYCLVGHTLHISKNPNPDPRPKPELVPGPGTGPRSRPQTSDLDQDRNLDLDSNPGPKLRLRPGPIPKP